MANSQVLWNKRVGEELANAGHDVTIYMMRFFDNTNPKLAFDPRIRVVHVNGSFGLDGEQMVKDQAYFSFNDVSFFDPVVQRSFAAFGEMYKSCAIFVKNKEFLAEVENSKYDLAFTHMYNFCGVGIIHKTKIPTWIWLSSGGLMDNVAEVMGVPLPPSYCPPMIMDSADSMTFFERIKSFIGHILFKYYWRSMTVDKETAVFKAEFGEDFPDLVELITKAPLVMLNSNELYDTPHPTLAKIVYIGGLAMKQKDAKHLKEEFASRVEKARGIVVMTFGSYSPMYLMPDHWKEAYFNAFAQFPDVQFFLRYEKPEEITDRLPPNAYAAKWLPQTDLLLHPKSLGLISHAGYNSVQDSLHAGVPILTTGLMGDQPKNARLPERLGMGVNLPKTELNKESVLEAIRRLVEDKSLKENAERMKTMIATRPVSSETLLVRWTEFLAEHKTLDNLVPYGTKLSFFVYHSLDVIALLTAVSSLLLVILTRLRSKHSSIAVEWRPVRVPSIFKRYWK
ncbi:hypothetical protein PENTCL1PPCAC_16704 [Pristionchus entomophagus]|uniref:glucuronosyltransferase n=1 Tax=Pristionchus entomophagus TaxID=358040 RepID=A0AAV5TJN5_9BILA|nr:hypothetical protein PENTCL1PPCAC_16704 [Pristionchus entomophagus]